MDYKLINRKILLKTSRFDVISDEIKRDKNTEDYTYVSKPNAVGVIVKNEDTIRLIEHYRYTINKRLLEIPGGRIENGESPKEAARREMEEEIGVKPKVTHKLGVIYPLPSVTDESIVIYWTDEVKLSKTNSVENEDINIINMSIEKIEKMIKNGDISSATDGYALSMFIERVVK